MNHPNPTQLQLGMSGTLGGRRYTVAGRVVLSVEIDGVTYFWNEFHVVNDTGESATLVYEEGDQGPEWRLFTLFEPVRPLSPAEAAAKRVGDTVNLAGYPARVTLVDQSRVVQIEGRAPEGVEVGDVADYFNLEAGNQMWVVSWTGDEVEHFKGMDLPAEQVARAFGLAQAGPPTARFSLRGTGAAEAPSASGWLVKILAIAIGAVILWTIFLAVRTQRASRPSAKPPTPAPEIAVGVTGKLGGREFRVAGRATLEVRQVKSVHDWHEYHLLAGDGARALLIQRLEPGRDTWHLLQPVTPLEPLTPQRAAALGSGDTVAFSRGTGRVRDLFQAHVNGAAGETPGAAAGTMLFGFRAEAAGGVLLARWTEGSLEWFFGPPLAAKEVRSGFSPAPTGAR